MREDGMEVELHPSRSFFLTRPRRWRRTSAPPRTECWRSERRRSVSSSSNLKSSAKFLFFAAVVFCIVPRSPAASSLPEATVPCRKESPLVGFQADLSMLQHQLRGTIRVMDDCMFKVTKFDMLPGEEVFWWGARSEALPDMLNGSKINPKPLTGIFNSQSFTVTLMNTTWEEFKVLAIWSTSTASDYGHVVLEPEAVVPAPAPAPIIASEPSSKLLLPPPWRLVRGHPPPYPPPPLEGEGDGDYDEDPTTWGKEQSTMLENCLQLSHLYRLRWTLDEGAGFVDIALEAAVSSTEYLGFGWADPKAEDHFMVGADLIIAGLDAKGTPFVEDYFASDYFECNFDEARPSGVCPDSVLGKNSTLTNLQLIHGQRLDGITFIRFRRKLDSPDSEFDYTVDPHAEMNIIWSHGPLRPTQSSTKTMQGPKVAESLVPAFHGTPQGSAFGVSVLTLDSPVDDCQSVLRPPAPDLGPTVVADRGTAILITSGSSQHFPNPPNPNRTLFINNHEAPVLKVERGVLVELTVQAGHDVPVYITNDPIGGLSDPEAEIFAGGEHAHGVPAEPHVITWTPNNTTPDLVFYQAYNQPKMGWMIQVVDGGLSDMYAETVVLASSKQLTFFWTLTATDISIAVRGEKPSGYLAVAFGRYSGMVNSWSYVGWMDENGTGSVSSYWMDRREPGGVHVSEDQLTTSKCMQVDGIITFEFSRPLKPESCTLKCHVINPDLPVKVVWAYGSIWTSGELTLSNMHTTWSSQATVIDLNTGEGVVENLQPVFLVHGFMMFLAWGILIPFGVLAARYLKSRDWYQIHLYTQCSALSVMVLGLVFAVGELQGFDFSTTHAKIGLATILMGLWQPVNAYFRPPKPLPGDPVHWTRVAWMWTHFLCGRSAVLVGFVALLTGVWTLEEKGGDEAISAGLPWAVIGWFATIAALVWFIERDRRIDRIPGPSMVGLVQHQSNGHDADSQFSETDDSDAEDTRNLLSRREHSSGALESSSGSRPNSVHNPPPRPASTSQLAEEA